MLKKITYKQLREALGELGYEAQVVRHSSATELPSANALVFKHPLSKLVIVLSQKKATAFVDAMDLLSVQNVLNNSGFLSKQDFKWLFMIKKGDSLIWNQYGKPIRVTAASDETDDGMVIIKYKETFSACPADQLERVRVAGQVSGSTADVG